MHTTTTAPAAPDIKQGRARALRVAGGALAAATAWFVEVPLLGWLVLALLERRTPHARLLWTTIALASLAASLALPLAAATTISAVAGLIVMHVIVGAVVIPTMAHTARAR